MFLLIPYLTMLYLLLLLPHSLIPTSLFLSLSYIEREIFLCFSLKKKGGGEGSGLSRNQIIRCASKSEA